ncbi:MAG: lamin tail domain-containing protein [Pirellulales bacterium]|nr:lamin tail domain-containing protein [Pirellulales bacterium]
MFEPLEARLVLDGNSLVINEFMAHNSAGLADEDGTLSDWIEIHNPTAESVRLDGWYLTDKDDDPIKWQFPDVSIDAGDYLLVFASEKNRNGTELHTNFKLSAGGEYLALVRDDGMTVEFAYRPEYPEQYENVSYGLSPDFSTQGYFTSPTPGFPNVGEPIDDPIHQIVISEIMYHPASEDPLEEYVELYNRGTAPVNLAGWQFTSGVAFTIPDVPAATVAAEEYLVIVADETTFANVYTVPEGTKVIGNWDGKLSNRSEQIELVNATGARVDSVLYADEGDWAIREQEGPDAYGHSGWIWAADHDGGGQSIELINVAMSNEHGQNWASSDPGVGPTPGEANSVATGDIAPMILDVSHYPVIPQSTDPVTVTARLKDETTTGLAATVYARIDGSVDFSAVAMSDDGLSGDGAAGDGVYGAVLPAMPDGTIVEFYVEATDGTANTRTWPAPARTWPAPDAPEDGQFANLLYQVDDTFDPDAGWDPENQPVYRLIMTAAEWAELSDICDGGGGEQWSDAQMNGTFINMDGTGSDLRYNVGIRNRGNGSRINTPPNHRVNFPHDQPWQGVTAININARYTYVQHIGHTIFRMAGLPAEDTRAVQVRVNGRNLARAAAPMYGSYVQLEVTDSDFADNQFPGDGAGNIYKAVTRTHNATLSYLGTDPQAYITAGYSKSTNASENDWSDLIHLTDVLNNASDATYVQEVSEVVNVDQWLRWFAIHTLFANEETNLGNGVGDDYSMYRGVDDPRFVLLPHDLDTILGWGTMQGVTDSIYRATALPAIERFLTHPEFAPRYHAALIELIETVFSPEQINPLLDHTLGGYVAQSVLDTMKQWVVARNAFVLSQIPQELTVGSDLPEVDGYPQTDEPEADLEGYTHAAYTRSVLVNGQPARWEPFTGQWKIGRQVGGETEVLVPAGAVWSYLDDGSDQQTAWRELDFTPDPPWAEGPAELGYGDGDEATVVEDGPAPDRYMTTYFRHAFEIEDASQYTALTLHLLRDDGAVVYFNGEEVVRSNMPEGDIDYLTRAWSNVYGGNTESTFHEYAVGLEHLRDGLNVLAVELHNYQPSSPDVSFDLRLEATAQSSQVGASLNPGINRVWVEAFDGPGGTGNLLDRRTIDIWYADGDETTVSGTLTGPDVVWDAASGPWHVTGDVTVPAGVTLTIEPGTTVFFDQDTQLTVNGRLVAEGTRFERIRFAPPPGSSATWQGLAFRSAEDNRLAYLDMESSSAAGQSIDLDDSRILIDDVTWTGTTRTILSITDSSLIVRNSEFPGTTAQTVSGRRLLAADPYLLFEHNTFGICTGVKEDVIDFTTVGSEVMPRFIGNVFLGGGDDALDLDGTRGYVEGNVFMNFHRNFDPTEGESYAVSSGYDGAHSSRHVIVRNVFIDCDNAALVKDRSWIDFQNNTLVDCGTGINFDEPQEAGIDPGIGAYLDGNIFWNMPTPLAYFYVDDPVWGTTDITVHRSIISPEYQGLGEGNLYEAPRLADPAGGDFRLLPGSPALGRGPNGLDIGAIVPAGASIAGLPPVLTSLADATLAVAGPGITHYKYRLDGGPAWSVETAVDVPIELAGLSDGPHALEVLGKSAAGVWQEESGAATATWTVDSMLRRVRINEVLAINAAAVAHGETFPDMIELVNDGPLPVDLAGMSISDDPGNPLKFVFPDGEAGLTTIPAYGYLVLYADDTTDAPGLHLGFSLDGAGEGVFLFDAPANGGGELDSVAFGLQLADLSIGRVGRQQQWALAQPTFGAANVPARTGIQDTLKINEWLADGDVLFDEDFLELYNPDPSPVMLGGLYLTDDHVARPGRHQIAPLSYIAGSGFAVFIADGDAEAGPAHLGFRLAPQQEILGLYRANLEEIDKVVYYPQTTDYSQGRTPDGAETFAFSRLPTPGLAGWRPPAVTTVGAIDIDADWEYDESGADLGTQWYALDFVPDPAWPTGPGVLGFEDEALPSPINTPLSLGDPQITTYYFRRHFTVDADPQDVELTITTLIDDGAVFYLNGHEVYRHGMPEGEINYLTPANRGSDYPLEGPFSIPIDYLVQGDNLIAVEVHQTTLPSSDVVFGLIVEATVTNGGSPALDRGLQLLDGLRITEIMYNPSEDGDAEFVELQNVGQSALDLTGVRFTEGIDFTFPAVTLAPNQYTVVVRDLEAFQSQYGPGVNVVGQYSGSLSNDGEQLVLQLPSPLEAAVLRFDYNDSWHPTTDGGGFALEIVDAAAKPTSWDQPGSWRAGAVAGGTPGTADGQVPAGVVINELLTHTDLPSTDTIELHNPTDHDIEIGGWCLSDTANNFQKFRIPDGTTIAAGDYLIFDEDDFNPTPLDPGPNDFALDGAHGDEVFLAEADAHGKVVRVVDFAVFGAAANGETFGRWPDGSGDWYPMSEPTLDPAGAPNSGPRPGQVVISEVCYNPGGMPTADDLEYVEIYNLGSQTVDLTNWRLRKGIDYDFAPGTMLDSGAVLVVVAFDPGNAEKLSAFRDYYGVDGSVQLVGGYSGQLSDSGERVQLQRPDAPPWNEPDFIPHLLEDEVKYDDTLPWPVEADGGGETLNRLTRESWGHDGAGWTAAAATPGRVPLLANAEIAGRHVFYNGSAFDGNNVSASALDDQAVAAGKTALLPGQTATFANYTSYSRGINGIMIDVLYLAGGDALGPLDFQFKVGNDNNPDNWAIAPAPSTIAVRPGAGAGGSDRITIIWPDYSIQKQWLQVTILPTVSTGLSEADVFYFGNATGEGGNSTADARVNATDMLLARNNSRNFLNPAPLEFAYDFNRDARVNATDMLIARNNQTHFLNALRLISVPGGKATATKGLLASKSACEDRAAAIVPQSGQDAADPLGTDPDDAPPQMAANRSELFSNLHWLYQFELSGPARKAPEGGLPGAKNDAMPDEPWR